MLTSLFQNFQKKKKSNENKNKTKYIHLKSYKISETRTVTKNKITKTIKTTTTKN